MALDRNALSKYLAFLSAGQKRLKELLLQRANRYCADCGAADPKWA